MCNSSSESPSEPLITTHNTMFCSLQVRGFLVERGMEAPSSAQENLSSSKRFVKGLSTPKIDGKFSLRASPTAASSGFQLVSG